ncbi:hypothetical protein CYMTET_46564 [Cymbomonas tetramitiformis]|uniref:Uncharacterized protein n=1 Tax=Cymbomonas tetramitiformis TaxID=36881 RepID=A0AAE0EWY2_9CHLO|nr:hypothetical protein CYMTET_46564 [Cymbomonas tetramitiformis]
MLRTLRGLSPSCHALPLSRRRTPPCPSHSVQLHALDAHPLRYFPRVRRIFKRSRAAAGFTTIRSPISSSTGTSNTDDAYLKPPDEILRIVDAPPTPSLSIGPFRDKVLILHRPSSNPPVAELARPEHRLAGLRIDPEQNSRSRMGHYIGLGLGQMPANSPPKDEKPFTGIPEGALLNFVNWAPDGRHIAFTVRSSGDDGQPPRGPLALWVANLETLEARPALPGYQLNTVFEEYSWVDGSTLVAAVIPLDRSPAPVRPATPPGPRIQSNVEGDKAQARTYQDLLKDSHDVALFEHYGTSQLVHIDIESGKVEELCGGKPRMYTSISSSPNGRFALVSYFQQPFSYTVPCGRFPRVSELWDLERNQFVREMVNLPLAENIPIVHNSCRAGRRALGWRADRDATLYWTEAQIHASSAPGHCEPPKYARFWPLGGPQTGRRPKLKLLRGRGDPRVEASPRDIIFTLEEDAFADGEPVEVPTTHLHHFDGLGQSVGPYRRRGGPRRVSGAAGVGGRRGGQAAERAGSGWTEGAGRRAEGVGGRGRRREGVGGQAAEGEGGMRGGGGRGKGRLASTEFRSGGVQWGDGELALLYESWYKTRRSLVHRFSPDHPERPRRVVFDRDYERAGPESKVVDEALRPWSGHAVGAADMM